MKPGELLDAALTIDLGEATKHRRERGGIAPGCREGEQARERDRRLRRERGQDYVSFWEFFQAFVALNDLELPLKAQHKEICDALQDAALGQMKGKQFVIINMPPRVGKTKICEALVCWQLAYFPESQILYTSYAHSLACESVRFIQGVMKRPWYQELYRPKFGWVMKADHFKTLAGGAVFGDGVGGSLTGRGAGLKRAAGGFIVIDDPAKPTEALSLVEAEQIRFWFENTLKSRRNSSEHTPIIICAQRLAEDDLPGFILKNYPEETFLLKFPALVNGESTIPETVSTESLLATKRVNPYAFASQYQQDPEILGGNLIKREWFQYWSGSEKLLWETKIITADTAVMTKQHNDWTVLQCWGRIGGKAYLIDQVRDKMDSTAMLSTAAEFFAKHQDQQFPVSRFIIEEAASGPGLINQLQHLGIPAEGIKRVKDKVARVMDILAYPRTGMVYFPRDASWLKDLERELCGFRQDGLSPHDDQVDAWADGINQLLGNALSILDVLGPERRHRR